MILPKLVITDIDGVWTDGGMYYDALGNELKKFNTLDSAGVLFLRENNIPLAIMTGEQTPIVELRSKKLKVEHVFLGAKDKLSLALELCQKLEVKISEVAFMGDDLNDIALLKAAGFSGCPANAPVYVKELVDFVGQKSGGSGAFREFVEHILTGNLLLEQTISNCVEKMAKPT